jgi:hypothetical protein
VRIKDREEKVVDTTLEHARLQGADLLRAQQHLGKRKFAPWLKANFPFRRQTAYKYMRIARHWELICQRCLQITSLEEVARKLFGKGKVKKNTEPASAAEAESGNSGHDEKPNTETGPGEKPESTNVRANDEEACSGTAPGEKNEVGAEADSAGVADSEENERTPESERHEEQNYDNEESACDENDKKPDRQTQKEGRSRKPREKKEALPNSPTNAVVLPIKNRRVNEHFQMLMSQLIDFDSKGYVPRQRLFPYRVYDVTSKEDIQVELILILMQRHVDACERLDNSERKNRSKQTKNKRKQEGRQGQ